MTVPDDPLSKLFRSFLLLATIVGLFGLAAADSCRYSQGHISCCKRVDKLVKKGGLRYYKCKECEDDHRLTSDKTQCVPDPNCARGTGPGLNGVSDPDDCLACSDDNCVDCSKVYYWCNICDDNYHANGQGTCEQNLLYR